MKKIENARSLTCKNETGSFSLRASMQNCNRDVVFCSLHVQLVTWSFNDRCLISLSCRTASISHCLRLSMDRISASHLASTCRSSSSHSPYKHEHKPDNSRYKLFSSSLKHRQHSHYFITKMLLYYNNLTKEIYRGWTTRWLSGKLYPGANLYYYIFMRRSVVIRAQQHQVAYSAEYIY